WTGGSRSSSLAGYGTSRERFTIPISRGSHLAVVLHGTALFAVTGVDFRGRGQFRQRAVSSTAPTNRRRSIASGTLSRRGVFLSAPQEGRHRSESYGLDLV